MENNQEERKYGEDSVYFNKERECYVAQFNKTIDGVKHRPSATGDTELEATKKLAKKKRKMLQENGLQKKVTLTFAQELDKMMLTIQGTVEDKTYNDYQYRVELIKKCSFCNRRISTIEKADIQQDINLLCKNYNLSASVCSKVIAFIKRCYDFSIENRHLSFHPIKKAGSIKIPITAGEEKNVLPLDTKELDDLLNILKYVSAIRPIISRLFELGLKQSEIIALRWNDLNGKDIIIQNVLKRVRHTEYYKGKKHCWYDWEIRNLEKPRTVTLDAHTFILLKDICPQKDSSYVFSLDGNNHLDFDSFSILVESSVRIKPIIYCMLLCGLRIAEVLALRWEDIDFVTNKINIHAAVKRYERQKESNDSTLARFFYDIGPPKTKSANRTVPFGKLLRECLLEWKQLQGIYAEDVTGKNLVFPKANGALQDYDSFQTILSSFLSRVFLVPSSYHTRRFRHTYASYLVKDGVEVKTLQKLLGHADIVTTLKYYIDTDCDSMNTAALKMDNVVNNISGSFSFKNAV